MKLNIGLYLMIKKRTKFLLVFSFVILAAYSFHLPSRGVFFAFQQFVKIKYGLSVECRRFHGGFIKGICMDDIRVLKGKQVLLTCADILSNIRFRDLFYPQTGTDYFVSIKEPKLTIENPFAYKNAVLPGMMKMSVKPLAINPEIVITNAGLFLKDSKQIVLVQVDNISGNIDSDGEKIRVSFSSPDNKTGLFGEVDMSSREGVVRLINGRIEFPQTDMPPVKIDGTTVFSGESICLKDGTVNFGLAEYNISGYVNADRTIDLEIKIPAVNAGNAAKSSVFLIKGTLDEPKIFTSFGSVDTILEINGMDYLDGKVILPDVMGEIRFPGFDPLLFKGGLKIGAGDVEFMSVTLADIVKVNGEISKNSKSRVSLSIDRAEGKILAERLPGALGALIGPHKIDAKIFLYGGGVSYLQGGGTFKMFSYPVNLVFRYRDQKISFCSVSDKVFKIYGSLNLLQQSGLKIRSCFTDMNFSDMLSIFTGKVDSNCKGIVNGEFSITGGDREPQVAAKMEIKDAKIGSMQFDVAYLNLEGTDRILNLRHSMVYYKDVPAELRGYIDLKNKDIFRHIEIIPSGDTFIWKGINVIKDAKEKAVIFGKDINENISVNFITPESSDPGSDGKGNQAEVEVKYKILDDKNLLIKVVEDGGTVGIEQKVDF